MNNVELIADHVIELESMISGLAEVERDGMVPPNGFPQFEREQSRRIRRCRHRSQPVRSGHYDSADRQLFSRIGVLDQDRSAEHDRLLFKPDDPRKPCGSDDQATTRKDPRSDSVPADHFPLITRHMDVNAGTSVYKSRQHWKLRTHP